MRVAEIKRIKAEKIQRITNILDKGILIATATFDKNLEYWLLNNTVWYLPRRLQAINNGTLADFTAKVNDGKIRAKFVFDMKDIDKIRPHAIRRG